MPKKKITTISFIVLTIINIVIFICRNNFQYQPYATDAALYRSCDKSCEKKWESFKNDYPQSELAEARQISDSLIPRGSPSTEEKILLIGNSLYKRFSNQMGKPQEELMNASPLNQYKKLCADASQQLWCGNFAEMFSFFCWSQNIVARNIEIMNPGDHHVLSECYLPEIQQWIMIDLTNNLLLVMDSRGSALHLQSFRDSLKKNSEISALQFLHDSVKSKRILINEGFVQNYYLKDNPTYYYHRVDNKKAYNMWNKLRYYCLPVSWYDIYDSEGRTNLLFYVKEAFLFLWLISFFVFIIALPKFRT